MNLPPPVLLAVGANPAFPIPGGPYYWIPAFLAALSLSVLLSVLRSALRFSVPERVLEPLEPGPARRRLEPLLEHVDGLAASASILKITCDLVLVTVLLWALSDGKTLTWPDVAQAIAIAAPVLLLFTETLPSDLARHRGDALLRIALPTFRVLQAPVGAVVYALGVLNKAMQRAMHLPDLSPTTRRIVEDLREVVEESDRSRALDEREREMIENVMDFRGVDVAAIMTPRTEIHGVEADMQASAAIKVLAESGHSRIPVYEDTIDAIIGTVTALDLSRCAIEGRLDADLRQLMRPAYFIPETKGVSELLSELRSQKLKIAVVLDEYGGTAGVVTMTDVLAEIVGEIRDEYEEEDEAINFHEDGSVEISAATHVTEVNEELDLELPEEEDFETLGGFVLAILGRFPKPGEHFENNGVEFTITDASDRRVLRVRIKGERILAAQRRKRRRAASEDESPPRPDDQRQAG